MSSSWSTFIQRLGMSGRKINYVLVHFIPPPPDESIIRVSVCLCHFLIFNSNIPRLITIHNVEQLFFLCTSTIEESILLHSPNTVLHTTPCCCLKLVIQPLGALISSMAMYRCFSLSSVPLTTTLCGLPCSWSTNVSGLETVAV